MPKLVTPDPAIRITHPKSLIVYLPEELRPFEYPKKRQRRMDDRPVPLLTHPVTEQLTGYVHGEPASDLEERLAIALDFFGIQYIFQYRVYGAYQISGEEQKIDFLVNDAGYYIPLEPGASFFHNSPSQVAVDALRMSIVNAVLMAQGIHPLGDPLYQIPPDRPSSIEDAKDLVQGMFLSA